MIIRRMQDELVGSCAPTTPESFLMYNRENFFVSKDLIHIVVKVWRAEFPLLLVERREKFRVCGRFRKVFWWGSKW